ncbi:transposase, IS605 OrfB family [Pseudomonas luteola]|uniref:Transposase, IS605 OrfB family n=2 Tax=Pseudomonas TaxID=286 RepID=A0A2X2CE08_PSELU|nr:transposase, IS605 OrfB family, central region [Pseudomonas lutea]SPZ04971.1 transposase, IS605 OrfB family [Pseudomonas luteola]
MGIDLGLKTTATCSDGRQLENGRFYKQLDEKLHKAQRAGRRDKSKAIHRKIANRRADALHKFSREIVNSYGTVVVGDISPTKLANGKLAMSVYDAGWSMLRTMLTYKCAHAGIVFKIVKERYTTRTCSSCGSLYGPKGVNGLRIREWTCMECSVIHDRDINAAKNILALGHERPLEEILYENMRKMPISMPAINELTGKKSG